MLDLDQAFPSLGLNMHHDDLFVGTTAPTRDAAEDRLAAGMEATKDMVGEALRASLAPHKAVVVASDVRLQGRIAKRLGRMGARGSRSLPPTWGLTTLRGAPSAR